MKILLLLSLISTMCSCLHKNADEGIWKNLPDKATIANIRIRFSWIAWVRQYIQIIIRDLMLIPHMNWS